LVIGHWSLASASGLFVVGTDTGVGKTYVAALVSMSLRWAGHRVGVYKPAASGCENGVSDDAVALWEAAGRPGELDAVCPQRFDAPLAPHLAARAEGKQVDRQLLRSGVKYWQDQSDIVIVEGAGGLLSPISDDDLVADLALELGYPLVIVAANRIGVINQVLQTLLVAKSYRSGMSVKAVVLNDVEQSSDDPSRASNLSELQRLCDVPVLTQLRHAAEDFESQSTGLSWRGEAKPQASWRAGVRV
jgi:dethiobiotin synthetase